MTQWQEQSLRAQGQPWPGMNSRGGQLDDGRGWLEDGSTNCQINSADILQKRHGFVRGLDEWFGDVVCGLFTYQDFCGQRYLLVATAEGIQIRQPFQLPQFTASDAYPNDDFEGSATEFEQNWRNTTRYVRTGGVLAQSLSAPLFTGTKLADDLFMRWFKLAGALSYEVRIDYEFDSELEQEQRIGIVIKGNGDLSTGALIQADIVFNPSTEDYRLELYHRRADLSFATLARQDLDGEGAGTLTLQYMRNLAASAFTPSALITPNLGASRNVVGTSLNALSDADLGSVSAIAIGQKAGAISQEISIPLVTGGPI